MKEILIVFLVIVVFHKSAKAQPYTLQQVTKAFVTKTENNPGEYSFIHTDRDVYTPGDELWCKIYFLNNNEDTNTLSKLCYLVLANAKGEVLQKLTVKVKGRSGSAVIAIPKNIANGQYFLAATTMWMQNTENNFLLKKIRVIQGDQESQIKTKILPDVAAGFFPESGSILAKCEQKIGVRTMNEQGVSIDATVVIKNQHNKVIARLKSGKSGMASFTLIASEDEIYFAEITDEQRAITKKISLPLVLQHGAGLSVNSNDKKIFVSLLLAGKDAEIKEDYFLLGSINGKLVLAETFKPTDDLTVVPLNKQQIPNGILKLLLVNKAGQAVAERLVWIMHLEGAASMDLKITGGGMRRTNQQMSINSPLLANADVSVRVSRLSFCDTTLLDIAAFSLLLPLLHAQLDHHPHQLKQILKDNNEADNLMLTTGWRKLYLTDLMKDDPLKYAFEAGIFLAGTLNKVSSKIPVAKGKVDLIIRNEDSTKYLLSEVSNEKGQFIFHNLPLTKKSTAYFSGTNMDKKNATVEIKFFSHFTDTLNKIAVKNIANLAAPSDVIGQHTSNEIPTGFTDYKLLKEARLISKKTSLLDSMNRQYVSALFENADNTIILKDEPGLNLWQVLQRNIPGLSIYQSDSGRTVMFNRYDGVDAFSENGIGTVQFFLNEQPVSMQEIETIIPADVALIKVYKGGLGYVLGAPRGGISIYTVKGKSTSDWRDKGFTTLSLTGYEPAYEFYSMQYGTPTSFKPEIDYRPCLYWNGTARPDATGKLVCNFATDDHPGPWLIELQGLSRNSDPLIFKKIFSY